MAPMISQTASRMEPSLMRFLFLSSVQRDAYQGGGQPGRLTAAVEQCDELFPADRQPRLAGTPDGTVVHVRCDRGPVRELDAGLLGGGRPMLGQQLADTP